MDRWEWLDVVRRARLGRTTKAVAVMLATYANQDGTRVFPGLARLAVVCEIGYNTAQKSVTELRDFGFIERVNRAGMAGRADEYRLILADDVHSRVPTPGQIEMEMQRVRRPWGGRPRHTPRVEVQPEEAEPLHTAQGEVTGGNEGTSTHGVVTGDATSTHGAGTPLHTPCVATNHVPEPLTTPDHSSAAARTDLEVSREATPDEDPISSEETKPRLRLVTAGRGFGFCLPCHAEGKTTLAADPVNGAACAHHLRQEAS